MSRSRGSLHSLPLLGLLLVLASAIAPPCRAQGGPPLVTDDPDTPPDGHWEINLAAIGEGIPGARQLSLPDADINYGFGDHIQLKLDTPWLLSQTDGGPLLGGLGGSQLGVKWRFLDRATSGFSMSTYPQVLVNFVPGSYRRGLTEPGQTWFLPIEASTEVAGFGIDGEVGRYLSTSPLTRAVQPDAWATGLILSRDDCVAKLECLFEVRETIAPGDSQTLINFGGRRSITESLSFMFAVGHDFGPATYDHAELLFYLGVQVLLQ
jgi:hypothetical protein